MNILDSTGLLRTINNCQDPRTLNAIQTTITVQTRAPFRAALFRCSSFLEYTPNNLPVALFLLLLHPPGTRYLLTFDCAKTFSLSNSTFTAIVLLWLGVSIASSTTADRQSVMRECPSAPVVSVSSSLSRLTADRRLLSMAGRAFKPRTHRSPPAVLVALLLLLEGVESNPGPAAAAAVPSSIVCGLLNARSVVNKAAVIHDVIADNKLAVLATSECGR